MQTCNPRAHPQERIIEIAVRPRMRYSRSYEALILNPDYDRSDSDARMITDVFEYHRPFSGGSRGSRAGMSTVSVITRRSIDELLSQLRQEYNIKPGPKSLQASQVKYFRIPAKSKPQLMDDLANNPERYY